MEQTTEPKKMRQHIHERTPIAPDIKQYIYRECGKICTHCGKPMDYVKDFTLEHVIPLSKGGTNDLQNLVALCETCNKKKDNDIIPPLEYFTYLPDRRKQELQTLFNDYLESYDWLSFNNLFMTDWFTVDFQKYIATNGRRKILCVADKAKITHLSRSEAFARLDAYRPNLAKNDRHMLVTTEEEIDCPYYSVKLHDKEIAFFSAFIAESSLTCVLHDWKYIVMVDWFTHFENTWRYGIEATIESLISRLLLKIQDTLLHGSRGTAIPVMVRMPESSPFAPGVYRVVSKMYDSALVKPWIGNVTSPLYEGRILHYYYILYQEKAVNDTLTCVARKDGAYYRNGKQVYPDELQKDLITRLQKAKKVNPPLYTK